jgi:hypothetical protein
VSGKNERIKMNKQPWNVNVEIVKEMKERHNEMVRT